MADKGHDTYTEPQPLNVPSFTRNDLEDTHVDGSSTPFDHTANPETASHTPVPEVALTGRVEQSHQTVDNTLNANPPERLLLTAVSQHNDSRSSPPPGVPKRGRKFKEVLGEFFLFILHIITPDDALSFSALQESRKFYRRHRHRNLRVDPVGRLCGQWQRGVIVRLGPDQYSCYVSSQFHFRK